MKSDASFRYRRLLSVVAIAVLSLSTLLFGSCESLAAPMPTIQPLLAYDIDYGMDQARGEQTLEYYGDNEDFGDKLREIIEQTLRNNVNHPDSKPTAKNSYKRESVLNDKLPEKRSSAFSKADLSNLRKTKNPKELLK